MSADQPFRVLLSDPSSQHRELALSFLHAGGIQTAVAASGPEALALAENFQPHVILTELILPGFSGLELIRRCRARRDAARIWVVTAASGGWATQAALSAGADFLFYKPVHWPELIRHLQDHVGSDPLAHVETFLRRLGLPPHWSGFSQTARCVRLLAGGECELLKEAYIRIAREDRLSPSAVARNVERCVGFLRASPLLPPDFPKDCSGRDFLLSLGQAAIIPL